MSTIQTLIFLAVLVLSVHADDPNYEDVEVPFYPKVLINTNQCDRFINSWQFKYARVTIYTKGAQIYIDKDLNYKMTTCLNTTIGNQDPKVLITKFHSLKSFSTPLWKAYKELMAIYVKFLTLVPQIDVLVGPGGDNKNVMAKAHPEIRDVLVMLGVAEVENIKAQYPDNFESQLQTNVLPFAKFHESTMIQFNAWHLINTRQQLEWDGLKHFSAILIYAEQKHRKKLVGEQVMTMIPAKFQNKILLDIGVPERVNYSGANGGTLGNAIWLSLLVASIAVH